MNLPQLHAQSLVGAVVGELENGADALDGHALAGVDGPHPVRALRDDRAFMDLRPLAGEQSEGIHDARHPLHRGAYAMLSPQADPNLRKPPPTEGLAAKMPGSLPTSD